MSTPEHSGYSERDKDLTNRLLSKPLLFPRVYKQWLVSYIGPEIQITQSQVSGRSVFISGAGSPEGAVAARAGSYYLRTDGDATTSLYKKVGGEGAAGWAARGLLSRGLEKIYELSNVSPSRELNANTVSLRDLADIVGTLIDDLQDLRLLGRQ